LTHGFVVDADGKKMSKSLGNVIAPKQVIDRYGAEVLRLWVSASDYRDDIRISENILTQLSDAYRRIRNTCRFILGNLHDFDPADPVPRQDLASLDRYAVNRLQRLVRKTRKAYDQYDFHVVHHALYQYCTLDLSAFYLDVLKDRLYTTLPSSAERRSAQTVMFRILDAMVRIMAPILPFTAEEIWKYMPSWPGKEPSVHLALLPEVEMDAHRDETLESAWKTLLSVRADVTRALEAARAEKRIGHPLDARVELAVPDDQLPLFREYESDLRSIFIVSQVQIVPGDQALESAVDSMEIKGLRVRVSRAEGEKCQRCWIFDPQVGKDSDYPELCPRCRQTVDVIQGRP
jgi:isoleucyl-tRNA synthetase